MAAKSPGRQQKKPDRGGDWLLYCHARMHMTGRMIALVRVR